MHRASTPPQQCAVQQHANNRKTLHVAARAATARAAVTAVAQSCMRRPQSCYFVLAAEMPRRMVPSGDSNAHDASTRVTRACTEAAALPTSQMKHCVQMLCCAPQARKICTKKVKVVPK